MKTIDYRYSVLTPEAWQKIEVICASIIPLISVWHQKNFSSRQGMLVMSLVMSLTMVGMAEEVLALERGNRGSQVKNLQSCLQRLGYFNGPVNGNFGPLTENALIKFQRANRISAIGKVGPRTQAALARECNSQSAEVSADTCRRGLRFGCDGVEVTQLQQNLQRLGAYNGPVTGKFRQLTKTAVVAFQRRNGIDPIGIVGPRTKAAISQQLNASSRPSPNPNVGRNCDPRTEIISEGCKGEWVRQLQQKLQQLNYYSGNLDGYFGRETTLAVVQVQRVNNLPVTGRVDSRTWGAISSQNRPTQPVPPPPISLFEGARGPQVTALQQDLQRLRYFNGSIDGYYGSQTREAVRQFQRNNGLPMTGSADAFTLEAIRSALQGGQGGSSDFEVISEGERSDRVKRVQQRLRELGYFPSEPTSYFGTVTKQAVVAFQENNGLPLYGYIDAQTWKLLDTKRYVVVVPIRSADTLEKVALYAPQAFAAESKLGRYVNAGTFPNRADAQRQADYLRDRGLDARVQFF